MKGRNLTKDEEAVLRQMLFVPPETKDDLHDWIQLFLDIDLPNTIVDPTSNSSPMDMLWETYQHARLNDDPEFNRVLYYSSRDSFKTLGAAILEVIVVILLRRNVAHMAAIAEQSKKAQEYVKKAFNKPILREYVTRKHEKRIEFTHPDGLTNYIQIIICTMAGANFEHVPFMVIDEVDVVQHPEAYEEAKFIPAPYEGNLPITLLTSTRKFSFGLVQKEIDAAPTTGLAIKHWNIMDVTQRCPAQRHLPDEPKIPIYRSDVTLKAISEEEFTLLPADSSSHYVRDFGYKGCLQNCALFAVCQGRLATNQTSISPLLKPISHVQSLFRAASLDKAKAQLLCWKPSTEGLVYTTLDRGIHVLSPKEMAEMLASEDDVIPEKFSKSDLVRMVARKVADGFLTLHAGIDWGYTHNYVFVLLAKDRQNRSFVLECFAAPGLTLVPIVRMTKELITPYGGTEFVKCYADSAYPMHIKSFRIAGFQCRGVEKSAGSVQGGIEIVRAQLLNAASESNIFFLGGDDGVEYLWLVMNQYHWKLDAAGKPTKEPDDENDDAADAIRYVLFSLYGKTSGIVGAEMTKNEMDAINRQRNGIGPPQDYDNWMSRQIREKIAEAGGVNTQESKGRKGNFIWNLGDETDEDLS